MSNKIPWSITITPEEPFSFGKIPLNATLSLQFASLDYEEKQETPKEEIVDKEDMPIHLKDRVKGKKVISKQHGVALQCCIYDETSLHRKKFVLACLSELNASTPLELHFDEDQVPNLSFETKGRPHLNKTSCKVSLFGYMLVKEITDEEMVNIAKEFSKNRAEEIKTEIISKRKELPKREQPKKKENDFSEEEEEDPEPEEVNSQYMQDGVEVHNITVGHGRRIKKGDKVAINYKGRVDPEIRKSFDRSKIGKPYIFIVGSKKVIKGISIGVTGMANNSKRELVIPSNLAFGKTGLGDKVPPNTTVYYDVEVVEVIPRGDVEKEIRELQKAKRRKYLTKMRNQESYVKDYDYIEVDE
eukprot:gene6349-10355_t